MHRRTIDTKSLHVEECDKEYEMDSVTLSQIGIWEMFE